MNEINCDFRSSANDDPSLNARVETLLKKKKKIEEFDLETNGSRCEREKERWYAAAILEAVKRRC